MPLLRYISHPNVLQDPDVPVPQWSLDDIGRRRTEAMLDQPWVADITRIISSAEAKARETAAMLGHRLAVEVEVREATGEIDRSATGYVPHDRHAELAGRMYAEPTRSADGWERAIDGQARVTDALADVLGPPVGDEGDVAVVGHGGVGTLLLCRLAGLDIEQRHDQPGQGHYWTYDRIGGRMVHRWRPIDEPAADTHP